MCTFNVYWLVNLRSQPIMWQGKRRRSGFSFSPLSGDTSREIDDAMSERSLLEGRGEEEGLGRVDTDRWDDDQEGEE